MSDWDTPKNAIEGRRATPAEFKDLKLKGLPKHALIENVTLGQCKKAEKKNYGRWYWTWGQAFLGFYGAINKAQLERQWTNQELIPFPKADKLKSKLGIGRKSMAELLAEASDDEEEVEEKIKSVKRKLNFDDEVDENTPPSKKQKAVKDVITPDEDDF